MEFVEIARFPSRLEAETIGHALDQYGISFFVQSTDIGMFGPGFIGASPGGAGLCVPEDRAEEAKKLLHCAVSPEDATALDEVESDEAE
ncbi:MAG: DUF2007 domain-containing protein [Acidobacteriota bacterium]